MNNLNILSRKYGTDKYSCEHGFKGRSFIDVYSKYFEPIRNNLNYILEIGVYNGASLRMWKEYFNSSRIYGIDINPDAKKHEEERIEIEIGDQKLPSTINSLCTKVPGRMFDIIIDDGSHVNSYTIESFKLLIDHLNPGGMYIIEDLHCSYIELEDLHNVREVWPGMKFNDSESLNNKREDFEKFFLEKITEMDKEIGNIFSIHFYSKMMILIKE